MPRVKKNERYLIAKWLAPSLARIAPAGLTRRAGLYLDVLQGLGSGTGWDMSGEARAVASSVTGIDRPVIFDGGANFGQWALGMKRALQPANPFFFLFEPQSACQGILAALPIRKILLPVALGATPGEVTIAGVEPGFGAASIFERYDTYFGDMSAHQELVPVVTIDSIVVEHGVESIDLLKLDVEGAELDALRGAKGSLEDGTVRTVAFEFGSANIYSRTFFRDFWDLLTPLGFHLFRIAPGGRLMPVVRYSEELEHFRGVSNYLATR